MQRSPAVLPLCGLNTAGEPCERQSRVKVWKMSEDRPTLLQKATWGGVRLRSAAPDPAPPMDFWRPRGAQEALQEAFQRATFWHPFFDAS